MPTRAALVLLSFGLLLTTHPVADTQSPPDLAATIQSLERDIPDLMIQAQIPGLSIAVVDGTRLAWSHGFGTTRSRDGVAVTEDTIFEAASLSKPVTAYAAMKLVDQGALRLDLPLVTYVTYPDLPDDPRAKTITARHVLSHTTGFANWRRRDPLRLFFDPGARFSYSGEGYVYLQRAMEAIAKEPLARLARRLVFEPLAMTRSTFLAPDSGVVAKPHTDIGTPLPVPPSPGAGTANAAASLRTTAPDYARFVVAVLNGTGLRPETAKLMLTAEVQLDPSCTNCANRPAGETSKDSAWGLGWGIEMSSGGEAIWHWGDNPGFKAWVNATRATRRGFVYFTNSDSGLAIRDRLVATVLGGNHPALSQVKYKQVSSR